MKEKITIGQKFLITILLLVIVLAGILGLYAWARYASTINGSASAQVAKWYFDLKNTSNQSFASLGVINLAETLDYQYVKANTIAPGTEGNLEMVVDTRGTEVDLVYTITVALSNCPTNLNFYKDANHTQLIPKTGNQLEIEQYLTNAQAKTYNETVTIYWQWPYETLDSNNSSAAGDAQDNLDIGKTVTMQIQARAEQVLEKPVSGKTMTASDYGKKVNYSITVDGYEEPLDDWMVFLKDGEDVWIIYGDYMPNAVVLNNLGSGLSTTGTYVVIGNNRTVVVSGLQNETYWTNLLVTSELKTAGAKAYGAATLDQWVKSWNDTHESPKLDTSGNDSSGYYIGTPEDPSLHSITLGGYEGYMGDKYTSLYWPYKTSGISGTTVYGYWLASPSAFNIRRVMVVRYNGEVGSYSSKDLYGMRPVICLPASSLKGASNNTFNVVP